MSDGEGYKTKQKARNVYFILGYCENDGVCALEELDKDGLVVPEVKYLGTVVGGKR